jgi:hypothetical protein
VRSEKTSQGNRRSSGLGNLSKISSYLAWSNIIKIYSMKTLFNNTKQRETFKLKRIMLISCKQQLNEGRMKLNNFWTEYLNEENVTDFASRLNFS